MLESAVLKQYLDLSCTVYLEGMSNGCCSYLILTRKDFQIILLKPIEMT